jgi:hypothetical protein
MGIVGAQIVKIPTTFDPDTILTYNFEVLVDQNGNVLVGL